MMKEYFPLSQAGQKSVMHLLVALGMYLLIGWLVGPIASAILGWLPLVGWLVRLLMWCVRIYCACGIAVAILLWFKLIK